MSARNTNARASHTYTNSSVTTLQDLSRDTNEQLPQMLENINSRVSEIEIQADKFDETIHELNDQINALKLKLNNRRVKMSSMALLDQSTAAAATEDPSSEQLGSYEGIKGFCKDNAFELAYTFDSTDLMSRAAFVKFNSYLTDFLKTLGLMAEMSQGTHSAGISCQITDKLAFDTNGLAAGALFYIEKLSAGIKLQMLNGNGSLTMNEKIIGLRPLDWKAYYGGNEVPLNMFDAIKPLLVRERKWDYFNGLYNLKAVVGAILFSP